MLDGIHVYEYCSYFHVQVMRMINWLLGENEELYLQVINHTKIIAKLRTLISIVGKERWMKMMMMMMMMMMMDW